MSSLRIDTAIKPSSYLRLLWYAILASILIVLTLSAGLVLWHYVVILVVTVMIVSYLALSQPILLHLSQPPLSQPLKQGWQLLMRTSHGDGLWQAELVEVQIYHAFVNIRFMVVEPYKKTYTVTVFRDQVTIEQWRQFNILANVTHIQTS